MQLEHAKYLYDIQYASGLLADFVQGKTWPDYEANAMLRAAVERQFEIIGEALNRVRKSDSETARRIPHINAIIATRNVIVHRYDDVDHIRVWAMLEDDIPLLIPILEALLAECD